MKQLLPIVCILLFGCASLKDGNVNDEDIASNNFGVALGVVVRNPDSFETFYVIGKENDSEKFVLGTDKSGFGFDYVGIFVGRPFLLNLTPGRYRLEKVYFSWMGPPPTYYDKFDIVIDDAPFFEINAGDTLYVGRFYLDAGYLTQEQRENFKKMELLESMFRSSHRIHAISVENKEMEDIALIRSKFSDSIRGSEIEIDTVEFYQKF